MPNGEPIGVAFVEVRPEVEDFRADAEADITAGLGDQAVAVKGDFQLEGVDAARADIGALTEEARAAIGELALQTSPEFAQGFVAGAQEAVAAAVELGDATEGVSQNLIDAEGARRAFAAANLEASASENLLAGATRNEIAAVYEADAAEKQLFRTRARRAASLGPLRLAGVGLGAGAALFAATQSLRELATALETTGEASQTFGGRTRNAFASLLGGDVVGVFKAFTSRIQEFSTAELIAINNTEGLTEAIKDLGGAADIARAQAAALEQLTQVPQFIQTAIAREEQQGDTEGQLQALRRGQDELHRQEQAIRDLGLDQQQTNAALEAVFGEQANIANQIAQLTKEARPDILAPLVEAVTNARLTGDNAKILAALRAEAAVLEGQIEAQKTSAADRREFKDALVGVNRDIESTQDAIVAEAQRHQQAMLDKLLDIGVLEDLQSQAQGGASTAGRSRRAVAIQAALDRGTINGKRLTRAQKEQLNAELVSINSAIESEQEAITAEAERHADEMERLVREQDQNFLDSLEAPGRRARNRQLAAAATAQLGDDIRASENLQRVYRDQIAVASKRIKDRKLRDQTIADLEDQISGEERNERQLRQQQRRERVDRRAESLDLNIELAAANENIAAEIRAHRAKIAFLTERIQHTRARTNQRKQLRLEIAQERAEIRRLEDEVKGDGADFNQLAFSFLQELQGFSSNLASNVLPGNFQLQPSTRTTPPPPPPVGGVRRPPTATTGERLPSPFEHGRGGTNDPQGAAALSLRETGGAPATAGQLETLINLSRSTNRLLGDIKRGVGHPEARTARELNRHRGGTVSVE